METVTANIRQLVDSSKHLVRRLSTIGENRLELLVVEVQEERERRLHAFFLALGAAAFGFLAVLALNIAIVIWLWNYSPVKVLLVMTGLYAVIAVYLYRRLTKLLREWKPFSATLDQLRKDRECLEKNLA
jgi:uncharacterized membrane protein YqjE